MRTSDVPPASRPVPEKLVARLWERQQALRLPLVTTGGEEIQVVYPGRRRWDRGPDFAGALMARSGARLERGEVEIHVRSSDWRAHGHHRDRHYNGVILQVVMWDDSPEPTLREDGGVVPVLALSSHLSVSLEELLSAPEADLPVLSPCWAGDGDGALVGMLDRCGLERFAAKSGRFESDLTCCSADQLLYSGIATALGYSQNREPFRRLSELLPLDLLLAFRRRGGEQAPGTRRQAPGGGGTGGRGDGENADTETRGRGDAEIGELPLPLGEGRGEGCSTRRSASNTLGTGPSPVEALMLGTAGLLPSQRGLSSRYGDGYVEALEACWSSQGPFWADGSMEAGEWQFFRVRPANFPTRRIAALARLVDRWPPEGMLATLAGLAGTVEPRLLPRVLERLLLGAGPEVYWMRYYDFGLLLRCPAHLIGRHRAAEIAVNVFLPLLAGWASHCCDGLLERRTLEVYRLYPKRGDNEITRYMATQITGLPRPRVARSACRQQGLLHLYWNWCENKRCGECPCVAGDGRLETGNWSQSV